jgi:Cu-Zn family superoxide dismutase
MTIGKSLLAGIALAALSACASADGAPSQAPNTIAPRTAWIINGEGRSIGQASFREGTDGVLIRLEFTQNHGLAPGWHGLHLHTQGVCSDFATGFQASGGHLGMSNRVQHGLANAEGPEHGDLPNINAPAGGAAFGAEIYSPFVTLGSARGRTALLDDDGTGLLIHAGADDHITQPIGGAGARVACAALTQLP